MRDVIQKLKCLSFNLHEVKVAFFILVGFVKWYFLTPLLTLTENIGWCKCIVRDSTSRPKQWRIHDSVSFVNDIRFLLWVKTEVLYNGTFFIRKMIDWSKIISLWKINWIDLFLVSMWRIHRRRILLFASLSCTVSFMTWKMKMVILLAVLCIPTRSCFRRLF